MPTKKTIGYCSVTIPEELWNKICDTAGSLNIHLTEIPADGKSYDLIATCDALFGDFTPEQIAHAHKLTWFQRHWAGVEDLCPLPVFQDGRAILTNASGAYNTMIAEHLLGNLLSLLHNLFTYRDAQKQHIWQDMIPADTIAGKRITVLGAGNIGCCFASMASALGATLTGISLHEKPMPAGFRYYYQIQELDKILPETDILVMTLPHTKLTENIIGARELALLPKGALLLNTGRGATIDEKALYDALHNGHLAGGMCDVFSVEPLPQDSPLWDEPGFMVTPHIAGHSGDVPNQKIIGEIFLTNMKYWIHGEPLINVVDVKQGF